MEIDTGTLAILVSVLLAIMGLATAWGALGQKVNHQGQEIKENRDTTIKEIETLHKENREDHQRIFDKLEEMNKFLQGVKHE